MLFHVYYIYIYGTDEDDLFEILQDLASVAIKWRKIGMALGLNCNTLDKIEHVYHDPDDQLSNMVVQWLKKNYNVERFGEPTWGKLAKAVRAGAGGGNSALAQRIEDNHCSN